MQDLPETLVREHLLIREVDVTPFWNDKISNISEKMWIPEHLQCEDSNVDNMLNTKMLKNTWVSNTLKKNKRENISNIPFSQTIYNHERFENEVKKVRGKLKEVKKEYSRKIRVFLNWEQKKIVKKWVGCSRYVYNYTLDFTKRTKNYNFMKIKTEIYNMLPKWCGRNAPSQVRMISIRDACDARNMAVKKFKKTGILSDIKYRSRKDLSQSIFIPMSAVKRQGIYYTLLGDITYTESPFLYKDEDEEHKKCDHDCRFIMKNGKYYLCVPKDVKEVPENQGSCGVVSLDPGIRTFQTFYSPSGIVGKFGNKDIRRLIGLSRVSDKLKSQRTQIIQYNHRQRQHKKKTMRRIQMKIENLVDEVHWKIIGFLTKNFSVIIIPKFAVKQIAKKLSRKNNRKMYLWSHYKFLVRLQNKCLHKHIFAIHPSEAYTSKTCSSCGFIDRNLGGRKIFRCPQCFLVLDRDYQGARNILLRALGDIPWN